MLYPSELVARLTRDATLHEATITGATEENARSSGAEMVVVTFQIEKIGAVYFRAVKNHPKAEALLGQLLRSLDLGDCKEMETKDLVGGRLRVNVSWEDHNGMPVPRARGFLPLEEG